MEKTQIQFLHLPTELKIMVIKEIKNYSDLKALSLTSKQLLDLTKPYLYYEVDLKVCKALKVNRIKEFTADEKDCLVAQRISSLLLQPSNLHFVKILKTGKLGLESTKLMNQLLPLLLADSLTKFSYFASFTENFPTPLQLQILWSTQKHLQNLKCCSYMTIFLQEYLKQGEISQNSLMKSITKLSIKEIGETSNPHDSSPSIMYWPLRNLNLYLLQSLLVQGRNTVSDFLPQLGTLFARGYFVNLKKLSLQFFHNFSKQILANVPSLESLALYYCGNAGSFRLRLVIPDDFSLKRLTIWDCANLKKYTPLLKKIKGLESLVIKFDETITSNRIIRNLMHAVVAYKETLRQFKLRANLGPDFNALLWDADVVKEIKLCQKLVDLSLPLDSTQPPYYCHLIASLPSLSSLTIYKGVGNWPPERALEIFPASTNLESVLFKNYKQYSNEDNWYQQRFIRKELQQICYPSSSQQQSQNDSSS